MNMATAQMIRNRTVKPIVLDHLVLSGEAERGADGSYLRKSQQGWEEHYAGSGKRLPTVGEYVRFIDYTHQNNHPAFNGIMRDLEENWLCAGKIDYSKSNIPPGDGYVEELIRDHAWRKAPQASAEKNELSAAVPYSNILSPERDAVLEALRPHVAFALHPWLEGIVSPKSSFGDVMQRIEEGSKNISRHSYQQVEDLLRKLYFRE